jgi:hypothetical protein
MPMSTSIAPVTRTHAKKRKHRVINLRGRGVKTREDAIGGTSDTSNENGKQNSDTTWALTETSSSVPESVHATSDPGDARATTWRSPVQVEGQQQAKAPYAYEKVAHSTPNGDLCFTDRIDYQSLGDDSIRAQQPVAQMEDFSSPTRPHLDGTDYFCAPLSSIRQSSYRGSNSQSPLQRLARPQYQAQPQLTGSILEQAWMVKMANEMAQRITEEKGKRSGTYINSFWERVGDGGRFQSAGTEPPLHGEEADAPPAYVE